MSNNDNKIDDKNRNVPVLRFEGFTDPWVQCKLGEVLDERNDQAPMNNEYPLMAFIANEGVSPKGSRYDRSALVKDQKNKLYKKTEFGDFIYSSNNLESGSIGLNKYGKASLSPVYNIFKLRDNSDSGFLGNRLIREDLINSMIKYRQGVIYGQWRVPVYEFLNIKVLIPILEEQRKVGAIIEILESLITLEQEKLEHLTDISNYLSSKLFPKKSKLSPILRKIQKSEAWEKYKLGESGRSFGGLTGKTKDDFGHGEAKYITYKNIFDNIFVNSNQLDATPIDHKQNKILFGDTIFTLSSETPEEVGMSSVCLLEIEELYLNSFCFGYRFNPDKKVNYLYLAYYFRSAEFRDRMRILAQGISRYNISQQQVMKLDILLPDIEEQEFVGQVLNKHYKYIKLQNEKIKKLQTLRQFLMQTLFI